MTYQFIDAQRLDYPVTRFCKALDVSPSGYYAWRQRPPSSRTLANQHLVSHMRVIHREVHETYGSPRMHAELVARGLPCNVKRGVRVLRRSAFIALVAYAALLLIPVVWLKYVLIAVINLSTTGWYAVLRAKCHEALPGQSGVVVAVTALANISSLFVPLLLGGIADAFGLPVAMWLLMVGPIALIWGVR